MFIYQQITNRMYYTLDSVQNQYSFFAHKS